MSPAHGWVASAMLTIPAACGPEEKMYWSIVPRGQTPPGDPGYERPTVQMDPNDPKVVMSQATRLTFKLWITFAKSRKPRPEGHPGPGLACAGWTVAMRAAIASGTATMVR